MSSVTVFTNVHNTVYSSGKFYSLISILQIKNASVDIIKANNATQLL